MSDSNQIVSGPIWAARNWSADAGEGSIHDDATAEELGFRGGTVAGDVHMNQFPPVVLQVFGQAWFERGNLSLSLKNATVDRERVQVFAEPRKVGADQVKLVPALITLGRGGLRGREPANRIRLVRHHRPQ